MGKPVVSVPIPEVVHELADVVAVASTPEEFLRQIEYEISHDCAQKQQQRIEFVRSDTWQVRSDEISTLIDQVQRGY
jgi:hypothetical protein